MKLATTALILALTSGATARAQVDEVPPRLEWSPAWGEPGIPSYVLIGASAAVTVTLGIIGPWEQRSTGGWLFDEDLRTGLWMRNDEARWAAADVADALLAAIVAYPVVVDSMIVSTWYHDNPEVGWKTAMITMETLAVTLALTQIFKSSVGRERPYGQRCGAGIPEDTFACDPGERNVSFLSGHTSLTFSAAAVTCSHHLRLPIYGGGGATTAAVCASGFGLAATTGLLRILSDHHYATDVLAGAALGTAVGFLLPWLLHYRYDTMELPGDAGVTWTLAPVGQGAGVVGFF